MRAETINVYQFDELSDAAKERARDWWRECENQDWHGSDYVFEDADRIAEILGIRFLQHDVKLNNGKTRTELSIFYSGFYSQGDGASFNGNYAYRRGSCREIRKYAPHAEGLHSIADRLQDIQRRNFYRLTAECRHSGNYYHSGCMSVCVDNGNVILSDATEKELTAALRSFADWIFHQLQDAYESDMSNESVDENIRANGYEFTDNGKFFSGS
ncbi:antitoxin of toxin-antitoxin stability system [Roseibium sp. Sym1]|uniref:antitoxin of toxin-antitoxin stability system n=1 Tax=Roseibium sp. Sym1 TaxID=3016006 RepID=UPI0022B5BD0D|nr:antitoxin of toxin-antitoxin stability system [Roseibium sp. Sym1]